MPLPFDGPMYELKALLAIAKDRLVFPSEIKQGYLFGPISKASKDKPVSDKFLREAVLSLKKVAPALYEKNKKILTEIPPLPKDWRGIREKKGVESKARKASRPLRSGSSKQQYILGVFESLLNIGTKNTFDKISKVPGAGSWQEIAEVIHSPLLIDFCEPLKQEERASFIKALAAYEDSVSGFGSTTSVHTLLPLLSEKFYGSVLDWVLQNTHAYAYYSTAPNVAEWHNELHEKRERRQESQKREAEKEEKARKRRVEVASKNLTNALRRNDIGAVCSLLEKGASVVDFKAELTELARHAKDIGKTKEATLIEKSVNNATKSN